MLKSNIGKYDIINIWVLSFRIIPKLWGCEMESRRVESVEGLIEMEKKHASSLSGSVKSLRNIVIKEILMGIAYDSQKHAGFYQAILNILDKVEPAITEEEYVRIEQVIKKHIVVEKKMMEASKRLLTSIKDPRIQHLLKEIYNDELKHHTFMKRILEAVVKRETIFDVDWWDFMWEGAPGHGAPLG
jgi:rubrerythrin